tara:strand:- start:32 stop:820 length:789 start_codon:yes stop_codon:yes gene_type:complete
MKKSGGRLIEAKLDFSNKIKKILKKYGEMKIRAIRIGRRPINNKVEKAFNIISLGKWSKLRDQYYYDKLFHLFLIITLEDGSVISLEKNSIVTMTENDERCSMKDVECIELDYPTDSITLNELVNKPLDRIGKERYFIYDPFEQNCQIFISEILKTFNLFSPKIKEFVYQDISDIVEKLPFYVKYIAKAVTDIDATISKVTGAGHKKCGCHRCVLSGGCASCDKCPLKQKLPTIVEVEEPEDPEKKDLEILTHFVQDMLKEI